MINIIAIVVAILFFIAFVLFCIEEGKKENDPSTSSVRARPASQLNWIRCGADQDWKWEKIEVQRFYRAKDVTPLESTIYGIGKWQKRKYVSNATGEIYNTSLTSCECRDFLNRPYARPCKHIIRLGMDVGILNANGYLSSIKSYPTYIPNNTEIPADNTDKNASEPQYNHWGDPIKPVKENVSVKRKRGRPKKNPVPEDNTIAISEDVSVKVDNTRVEKRKGSRGRPKKIEKVGKNTERFFTSMDGLIEVLRDSGVNYVDLRNKGGCLWVASTKCNDEYLKTVRVGTKKFSKASRSKALKGKAGWFIY